MLDIIAYIALAIVAIAGVLVILVRFAIVEADKHAELLNSEIGDDLVVSGKSDR